MRSRVPVYDESRGPEHIVGVVYSKDLARLIFFRRSAAEKLEAEGDGAFNPRAKAIKSPVALTTEDRFSPISPLSPSFSAASLTPEGSPSATPPERPVLELKLSQIMRDILVVPETKTVLDLIREFQSRRRQIAIVVDEYGSTVGLVTAEDAIEQLTGELEDEFDSPALPVLTTASGALLMDGGVNLRDLETQIQWKLPRDGGVETLAGFLLMRLGHIPLAGESVIHEGRRLTVVEMEGRRIARIRVEPVEEEGRGVDPK